MGIINPTMPTIGDPRGAEEIDLANAVQALLNEFNGNVESANIAAGTVAEADLTTAFVQSVLRLVGTQNLSMREGRHTLGTSNAAHNDIRDFTLTHNLGKVPRRILLQAVEQPGQWSGGQVEIFPYEESLWTTTTARVRWINRSGGLLNINFLIDWLVIG